MGPSIKETMWRHFAFTGICLLGTMAIPSTRDAAEIHDDDLCPHSIVKGSVQKSSVVGNGASAAIKIEYVFKGPPALLGKSFEIQGAADGQSEQGAPVMSPRYQPGEVQIWTVRTDGNTLRAVNTLRFVDLPARKGIRQSRFAEVEQWAKAVEEVLKITPNDRADRLLSMGTSKTREVADWAKWVLDRTK